MNIKKIGLVIVGLCIVVSCYGLKFKTERIDLGDGYIILKKSLKDDVNRWTVFRVNKSTGEVFVPDYSRIPDPIDFWIQYAKPIGHSDRYSELFYFDVWAKTNGENSLIAFDRVTWHTYKLERKSVSSTKNAEVANNDQIFKIGETENTIEYTEWTLANKEDLHEMNQE